MKSSSRKKNAMSSRSSLAAAKAKPAAKKTATSRKPAKPRAKKTSSSPKSPQDDKGWNLRLYVAGQTPRSLTAFSNLKRLCDEHLQGSYQIEVVDLMKHPELAQRDQIVAIPTLVRKLPAPIKRVVGDLSNLEKVMVGIEIRPVVIQG